MTPESLQDWLLAGFGVEKFLPGLARLQTYLAADLLRVKELSPQIITIAGTNGKGETAHTLAAMARTAGLSYVLWTSPHLLSVTERFQNAQGQIQSDELWGLVEKLAHEAKLQGVGLSYYEALWVAFIRWGLRQQARLWILEVGLGGRLDAVNLLDAQFVGLTSISRDHQEFLGPTYRSILREKLGVVRPGSALVSALESRYLREETQRALPETVQWIDLFAQQLLRCTDDFSSRNRRLAQVLWQQAGLGESVVPKEMFPGRGDKWSWQGHRFTFYGSHNPDGMRKMVQFLQSASYNEHKELFHQIWVAFSQRPVADVLAMMKMVRALENDVTKISYTRFIHPKAATGKGWWGHDEGSSAQFVHEWPELFDSLAKKSNQRVLVVGSYYFVALVQAHLLTVGAHPTSMGG